MSAEGFATANSYLNVNDQKTQSLGSVVRLQFCVVVAKNAFMCAGVFVLLLTVSALYLITHCLSSLS